MCWSDYSEHCTLQKYKTCKFLLFLCILEYKEFYIKICMIVAYIITYIWKIPTFWNFKS
jgi:hypothetical protein